MNIFRIRLKSVDCTLSKAALARLQTEARESDVLARHLAIQQAIAETPLVVNKTQLLRDGAQAFHAIFAAIRQARKHVHLEHYIVEDVQDDGEHLSDLLTAKRREGVEVALIYDSYGSASTPTQFLDRLPALIGSPEHFNGDPKCRHVFCSKIAANYQGIIPSGCVFFS